MKPPKHLFIEIMHNEQISQAAALEAGMTYLKFQSADSGAEYVHIYPEIIHTQEEIFLFAMEYGKFLNEFQKGFREVPEVVKEIYFKNKNNQN